jgi:hypothetical protein
MFKDISKIRYSKITDIIRTNIDENKYILLNKYVLNEDEKNIYNLKIIFDDGNIQVFDFNKTQYDLFCKISNDIKKNIKN